MAKRPVYIPTLNGEPVKIELIEFTWNPGFALVQKQKNINELHKKAKENNIYPILEISTKSPNTLGQKLSAFNLKYEYTDNLVVPVEAVFQSSKVFEKGGPYRDLVNFSGKQIKKDVRLKNSGKLLYFLLDNEKWKLEPKTAFYDWLYINALLRNRHLRDKLLHFKGFTDIEFNPQKQINCQAYSAALFVSLVKRGIINEVIKSKESFLDFLISISNNKQYYQPNLFE